MTISERIEAFVQLGFKLKEVLKQNNAAFEGVLQNAWHENNWFDPAHSLFALTQISDMLTGEHLKTWINRYNATYFNPAKPLRIGVVMAGNLPLVGFHDMLCVLISGHIFIGKMSSEDRVLWKFITGELIKINPDLNNRIALKDDLKDGFDAVIATGNNNTARYFEHYFGRYPHIIRQHRNSIAILNGKETTEQLNALADDICLYYGRGCRSVSKLFVPKHFPMEKLIKSLEKYARFANHHKYFCNYEYHKALMLINKVPFMDTGFMLFAENDALASPVGVLHYTVYIKTEALREIIKTLNKEVQCVATHNGLWEHAVAFGHTQKPRLWDYADGVDTIEFLNKIMC